MLEREPLDVLLGRLEARRPSRARPLARERLEASITTAEAIAVRLGLANTCLYRSLARYAFLRSHGIPAVFCMGVDPPPKETGHAWIEDEGGPYREEIEEGQYVVTFYHPRHALVPRAHARSSNLAARPSNELIDRALRFR